MTYPLPQLTKFSYRENPRSFNSPRLSVPPGRKHGAIDFYAPHGTPLLACLDGLITSGPYNFVRYQQNAPFVQAIEIQHGVYETYPRLTFRYAEAVFLPHIKTGYTVKEGEQLGWVVRMAGLVAPGNCMLHLEAYSGLANGPLTISGRLPYFRRADLIDPTPIADKMILTTKKDFITIPSNISMRYQVP